MVHSGFRLPTEIGSLPTDLRLYHLATPPKERQNYLISRQEVNPLFQELYQKTSWLPQNPLSLPKRRKHNAFPP